jgi:hypothetical protein
MTRRYKDNPAVPAKGNFVKPSVAHRIDTAWCFNHTVTRGECSALSGSDDERGELARGGTGHGPAGTNQHASR